MKEKTGRHVRPLRMCFAALAIAGMATSPAAAAELWEKLEPAGHVNDFAGVISPEREAELERRLAELQKSNRAEVAIVIIQSMEGGQIDDFANKLFNRWGVGAGDHVDNGALLLVAMKDRKARIEVGYGLEPILPDALAGRILDQELFPAFREQRYETGVTAAANRLIGIVAKNEPASLVDRNPILSPEIAGRELAFVVLFFCAFVAIGFYLMGAAIGAKVAPLALVGALFGGMPALMALFICGFWSMLIHWPLAIYCGYRGFRGGRKDPKAYRGGGRRRYDGGWTWGTFAGGSSRGGGFSGGGFSSGGFGGFGGGRSGGGGASGGW